MIAVTGLIVLMVVAVAFAALVLLSDRPRGHRFAPVGFGGRNSGDYVVPPPRGGPLTIPNEDEPSALDRLTRERVLVTLKSGVGFDGVLFSQDDRTWILRQVEAVGAGENGVNLPVDGELLVFVADIAYVQRP